MITRLFRFSTEYDRQQGHPPGIHERGNRRCRGCDAGELTQCEKCGAENACHYEDIQTSSWTGKEYVLCEACGFTAQRNVDDADYGDSSISVGEWHPLYGPLVAVA